MPYLVLVVGERSTVSERATSGGGGGSLKPHTGKRYSPLLSLSLPLSCWLTVAATMTAAITSATDERAEQAAS